MISKEKETSINIVFEDDVMCSSKLFSQLNSLYSNINEVPWDIVLLGQPSEEVQNTNNLSLKKISPTNIIFPCIDSYLIKPSFAKTILINFFPLRYPLNIQLSYVIDKMNNQNCYKIFPNITGDGSKIGIYTSSILPNNVLLFNNIYKTIYTTLENNTKLSEEQITEIKALLDRNEYKQSPDFIHIEALLYMKIGDLQKSKDLFEKAYDTFTIKKSPMNNTSVFLKNYINIFKMIQ
jgi:GR25 family glycosyltransferase involved in LPS biosynthesis